MLYNVHITSTLFLSQGIQHCYANNIAENVNEKGKVTEHKLVTTGERLSSCLFKNKTNKGNLGIQKTILQLVTRWMISGLYTGEI